MLGLSVSSPIAVAPSAMQRMAHPDGELATVRACQKTGSIFVLSTISTTSIEDVAAAAPNAIKWFQLYVHKDRGLTESLVQRAEAAGFKALVLTVDTPALGTRLADRVNRFELPAHLKLANLDRSLNQQVDQLNLSSNQSALETYAKSQFDTNLCWDCIDWLRSISKLPIIIKGILTAEDAKLAVQHLVDGIIVSNHGARQLDYVPATVSTFYFQRYFANDIDLSFT
jgi:(S)-2-hydroxy-acid oxidase